MEKRVLYLVLILVAAAIGVAIYLEKGAIAAAIKGSSSTSGDGGVGGTTSTTGGGATTTTASCTYPVDMTSNKSCILQAFKDSGYWGQLNSTQQANASNDPSSWLHGHPYLYTVYPEYFTQA